MEASNRSIVSIVLRCSKYHLVMCYIAVEHDHL